MTPEQRLHVVYLSNIPTPYVVGRFNALSALLAGTAEFTFEAWFRARREPDRSWSVRPSEWRFDGSVLLDPRGPGAASEILRRINASRPTVFVSLYHDAVFISALVYAKARGARVGTRVVPTYDAWVGRTPSHEFAKHVLFRRIDGAFVSSIEGYRSARRYRLPPERATFEVQSIDVDHFAKGRHLSREALSAVRVSLGLNPRSVVFLYVGRITREKGVLDLIRSFNALSRERDDVELLVVGDGRDESAARAMALDSPRVAFAGFKHDSDLPEIYGSADVFVFPTHGDPHGLVIEEAMAAGLPIISTRSAGDIHLRVIEDINGLLVDPQHTPQLLAAMNKMCDESTRRRMQQAAPALDVLPRHDEWAAAFVQFVRALRRPATNLEER